MQPSEESVKEILLLLEEAHQQLLDTRNYGIDLLVYRAIQLLRKSSGFAHQNGNLSEPFDGMDLLPMPSLLLQDHSH